MDRDEAPEVPVPVAVVDVDGDEAFWTTEPQLRDLDRDAGEDRAGN